MSLSVSTTKKLRFGIGVALVAALVLGFGIWWIHDLRETRRLDATSVTLKPELTVEFGEATKVSDFIANLQGSMIDDFTIDTTQLGEVKVKFEYINSRNRRRPYEFTIQVIDTSAPKILGRSSYTVAKGYTGDLTALALSGDFVDDNPVREIVGTYDLNRVGNYPLTYVVTDASGNRTEHKFTLNVVNSTASSGGSSSVPSTDNRTPISAIIASHKNPFTSVGIDVSSWQGEIDWQQVKQAGVEFAIMRLGYQKGYDGENIIDSYFEANIDGAKSVGLPVGIYYYSYAQNSDQARAQAEWVLEQLHGRELELGITFDWESWADFNELGMSFHTTNHVANTFLDRVAEAGYSTMLYGSKYYLEQIWCPGKRSVWLAQYYDYATYEDPYDIWQMTDSGKVPGIAGSVDVDIKYINSEGE